MATSVRPGVESQVTSNSNQRPFASKKECVVLQGAIMVGKQRSVPIAEMEWSPFQCSLVEYRNRGKLCLQLIISHKAT